MIKIKVLGPFEAYYNGHKIEWQPMQQLLIQAMLVTGRPLESHELVDMLWERPTEGASQTKLGHVSRLRKPLRTLGGSKDDLVETIKFAGGGFAYRLADGVIIDAVIFREQVRAGLQALREQRLDAAAAQSTSALELWRGDPLPGASRRPWALGYVEQLEEDYRSVVVKLLEANMSLGRHREAVSELRVLTRRWPDEDDVWRLLPIALYRSGRIGEALTVCRSAIDTKRSQGHDERQFLDLQQDLLTGTLPLSGPLAA